MIVTCVTVYVKQEYIEDFIQATIENHEASIQEPGNLRFDFLQCVENQSRFFLYEAYTSEDASAQHKETPHYLKWRETVAGWMARPREGIKHKIIKPEDVNKWNTL
jgi:autoinducer 2-degrading protein